MPNSNSDNMNIAGIGAGGLLVIAGILIAVFGSNFLGIIVAMVGLIGFGGFVKGKWY